MTVSVLKDITLLLVPLLTLHFTRKNNKETAKLAKKAIQSNEKLNQKNIDASLKADARIKWIQDVRNTAAELISLYYAILILKSSEDKDENKNDLSKALLESRLKTELLIMYFGPEKFIMSLRLKDNKSEDDILKNSESNESKNDILKNAESNEGKNDILKNAESNEGKNDEMVKFLSDLNENFYNFYNSDESTEDELKKKLVELRDYIRKYLKLEWNIAKEGK